MYLCVCPRVTARNPLFDWGGQRQWGHRWIPARRSYLSIRMKEWYLNLLGTTHSITFLILKFPIYRILIILRSFLSMQAVKTGSWCRNKSSQNSSNIPTGEFTLLKWFNFRNFFSAWPWWGEWVFSWPLPFFRSGKIETIDPPAWPIPHDHGSLRRFDIYFWKFGKLLTLACSQIVNYISRSLQVP